MEGRPITDWILSHAERESPAGRLSALSLKDVIVFPITPCLSIGQLRQVFLWLVLLFHETNHKQPSQDLPDEDETEPLLHKGLHPHRQLRGDGLHPLRHPHPTQPQALSGYQGDLNFVLVSFR